MTLSAMAVVLLNGCEPMPPPVVTPPPSTPRAAPSPFASVGVAVPAASPSPTAPIVGDYGSLVRDRVVAVQAALAALDAQFALLKDSPFRITQDDWRTETLSR